MKLAYEIGASRESFEKIVEIMSREVPLATSNRYNATFDEKDLHRSLIHLAVSNGYAESGMESLVTKGEPLTPPEKIPEELMVQKLKNALNSTVLQLSCQFCVSYAWTLRSWLSFFSDCYNCLCHCNYFI